MTDFTPTATDDSHLPVCSRCSGSLPLADDSIRVVEATFLSSCCLAPVLADGVSRLQMDSGSYHFFAEAVSEMA